MTVQTFHVKQKAALVISHLLGDVTILPGNDGTVTVEINGTENQIKQVSIRQQGDKIEITSSGRGISINNGVFHFDSDFVGSSVFTSGDVTYVYSGGTVIVNDRVVQGNGNVYPRPEPLQVKVYAPSGSSADVKMVGSGYFVSSVALGAVDLDFAGSCKFALTDVKDLDIDISGSVEGKVNSVVGDLDINISGSANVEMGGEFSRVKINASGSAAIATHGTCQSDYTVKASGMCQVNHHGRVSGRVTKKSSGMCSVNV